MKNTKRNLRAALLAALLGATLLTFPGISAAADDSSTAASVQSKLGDSKYKNVKVTVENSIAILSGTVDLYEYKADAEKRVAQGEGRHRGAQLTSRLPAPASPTRNCNPSLRKSWPTTALATATPSTPSR